MLKQYLVYCVFGELDIESGSFRIMVDAPGFLPESTDGEHMYCVDVAASSELEAAQEFSKAFVAHYRDQLEINEFWYDDKRF